MPTGPTIVSCPVDVWTKVATSVTAGMIYTMNSGPIYLQSWRETGVAAPTLESEGVGMDETAVGNEIKIDRAIDVYVMCLNSAGSVRVDV